MSIDRWIKIHEASFGSPFEHIFVIKVLAKVNDLDLNTVNTQYHFKDLDGKNRYCDFAIQEGSIKIAIEIDGYDKQNTGQGMSHDDFVDWQRRQSALTAYGWHVLRFANRDVSNEPGRCQRYIELLLRDQRSKSQHQANLEDAIGQLKIAQSQAGASEQADKLQREISRLKNQLILAQNTQPLNSGDKIELEQLVIRLEQENQKLMAAHDKIKEEKDHLATSNTQLENHKQVLDGENNTMKTTIWAFTTIIGIFVAAGVYLFTGADKVPQASPIAAHALTSAKV
jgi:very-short-patch-repair endonuclease